MSSTLTPHPDREMLLRLLDDDLSRSDRQSVDSHVGSCRACQRELEEVRGAAGDYLRFHNAALKAALPPPPKPWDRLDVLAARIPGRNAPSQRAQQRSPWFRFGPGRWLAAAAAVAAVFVFIQLGQRTPEVKAAELLQKAKSAEKIAPARTRLIRIKSRKYAWNRPARLAQGSEPASPDASGIRQLLESAGYNWDEPLSATAYAAWHDRLPSKQDRVESTAQGQVIHTTTTSSPISDASLTLAPDLHAVSCTLRFGETDAVEMSELPEEEPAMPANAPRAAPLAAQPAPATLPLHPAGPGEELQVIAALHRLGADLGEPVDVKREGGNVFVNVTGADPRRQTELKSALAGLPAVRLQFGEFQRSEGQGPARRPATQVDNANPILSELQTALAQSGAPADLADQLSDSTEKILNRTHALRSLARRFETETAAHFSASEVAVLRGIVLDHLQAIELASAGVERLMRPLLPLLPRVSPAGGSNENTWQDVAEAMLVNARELDQAVNASGAGDSDSRKLRAAHALADLAQHSNRLRTLIQP